MEEFVQNFLIRITKNNAFWKDINRKKITTVRNMSVIDQNYQQFLCLVFLFWKLKDESSTNRNNDKQSESPCKKNIRHMSTNNRWICHYKGCKEFNSVNIWKSYDKITVKLFPTQTLKFLNSRALVLTFQPLEVARNAGRLGHPVVIRWHLLRTCCWCCCRWQVQRRWCSGWWIQVGGRGRWRHCWVGCVKAQRCGTHRQWRSQRLLVCCCCCHLAAVVVVFVVGVVMNAEISGLVRS